MSMSAPARVFNFLLHRSDVFFPRSNSTMYGLEKRLREQCYSITQFGLFVEGKNVCCKSIAALDQKIIENVDFN